MGGTIFLLACFLVYFIPAVVGFQKKNANAIIILNIFLGWTLIGWVIALIWAVIGERQPSSNSLKKCPFCAETIKSEAKVCRYCGKELPEPSNHSDYVENLQRLTNKSN